MSAVAYVIIAGMLALPAVAAVQGDLSDPAAVTPSEQSVEKGEEAEPTTVGEPATEPSPEPEPEPDATTENTEPVEKDEPSEPAEDATEPTQPEEPQDPATNADQVGDPSQEPSDETGTPAETTSKDGPEEPIETEPGISTQAETPEAHIDGGTITGPEDNELTWEVTENDAGERTLTISGTGPMPDYNTTSNRPPYQSYLAHTISLVIGDEITCVGNYAFSGALISSIDFGSSVATIGTSAFDRIHVLTELYIPGNVKIIRKDAFNLNYNLRHVELAEGVQTIEDGAFDTNVNSLSGTPEEGTLKIPASLTNIGVNALGRIFYAYEVDPENPFYSSTDGVLYSKDGTTLVDYPSLRTADEFIVPDGVRTIANGAFTATYRTDRFVIPGTVESIIGETFRECRYLREVYIADGVEVNNTGMMFYGCDNIQSVRLPEDTPLKIGATFSTNPSLTSITIPAGTTSIAQFTFGGGILAGLETLTYNASNAKITEENVFNVSQQPFELVIGKDVDVLPAGFDAISRLQSEIHFEPNNQITIEAGAFASADEPLTSLSGTVYVDDQGILYSYDAQAGTATLVNIPNDVVDAKIPATLTPEPGVSVTVTGVAQNAAKFADLLKTVTFDSPESVTDVALYAFANCPSLVAVNDKTTVDEARSTFPNATFGTNPFYNTGLNGASGVGGFSQNMHGQQSLTANGADVDPMSISLSSEGSTLTWQPAEDGNGGGYRLLTGDTLTITANIGNQTASSDARYRVYLRLDGQDATLSVKAGDPIEVKDPNTGEVVASGSIFATSDPYTVYVEFARQIGGTISLPLTAIYPSPTSSGGGLTIWGIAGASETEESENHTGQLVEPSDDTDVIQAYWTTEPDSFAAGKESANPGKTVSITGDGSGSAILASDVNWTVRLSREDESSNYGKDFARSVDYVDTPELPTGVSWAPEVLESIKSGDTRSSGSSLYAGDTLIATISATGISGRSVSWNEDRQCVEFHWHYANGDRTQEAAPPNVSLSLKSPAFTINLDAFGEATDDHVFANTVETTIHYTHGKDQQSDASAQANLTEAQSRLTLTKSSGTAAYFGEDIDYTLTIKNQGAETFVATATGSYTLTDELSSDLYLKPSNIQRMFENLPEGTSLTITINHATLGTWEAVTAADGVSEAWRTPANTALSPTSEDATLSITASYEGSYEVAVKDGGTYRANTVEDALSSAGYAATQAAQYTYVLALNDPDTTFELTGGASVETTIHATVKTSFELLGTDRPTEYPEETTRSIANKATLKDAGGKGLLTASSSQRTVRREATIGKYVMRDGEVLSEAPVFNEGDVLDYVLDFDHFGGGTYENLPMVDDLYGAQYLLVPTQENESALGSKGLEKMTVDGTEYYVLTEGTYENVKVGYDDTGALLTAATVTVTKATDETATLPDKGEGGTTEQSYSGLHTKISWYFSELPSESYRIEVRYKALVSSEAADGAGGFSVGNVVWMNDLPNRRINAGLWGGGSILNFKKHIVEGEGAHDPATDSTTDYSLVGPGDTVTYRLDLRNDGTGTYALKGADLADALPQTFGSFDWDGRVSIETKVEGVTVTDAFDRWQVSDTYGGASTSEGQHYITWPEDETIVEFGSNGRLYVYITLSFPTNSSDEATWDNYAEAADGSQVQNTLWVCGFASNVTHDLRQRGEALVQKGVYATYRNGWTGSSPSVPTSLTSAQPARNVFNNADAHSRWVQYYAVIMNTGNARLYLNDLYDRLPEGFTFGSLRATASGTTNNRAITTRGGANEAKTFDGQPFVDLAYVTGGATEGVRYKSASVTVESSENGVVRLSLGAGSGEGAVKYDEARGQYYLDRDEAIVFGYLCSVGFYSQTQDTAPNALAMPYEDYLGTGVVATGSAESDQELTIRGDDFTEGIEYNDGSRLDLSAEEVAGRWSLADDGGSARWLASEVTMRRSTSTPGVSKRAVSYTLPGAEDTPYEGSASPNATINWETTLRNDGPSQIMDYTVTDTMEAPYVFVGNVALTVTTADGVVTSGPSSLFSVASHTADDDTVTFTSGTAKTNVTVNDEEWTTLPNTRESVLVKISRTDEGETLSVRLLGSKTTTNTNRWMIPESGGKVTLSYHTENTTGSYASKPYVNDIYFEPDCEFDSTNLGSLVRDEAGEAVGVTNSAPVNVAFGVATSSDKTVTEVTDPDNTARATGDPNVITLGDTGSTFTYGLTVKNVSDQKFDRMVLIDSLPAVGDTSPFDPDAHRNSQFGVRFADDPQVKVTVVDANGQTTLTDEQYRVEFSESSVFTDDDWSGAASTNWTTSGADARSLRVVLEDEGVVPAGATISVSFVATVDGEAEPGAIAWNSFGYRYMVPGSTESTLSAVSLPVGVKVPTVPELVKQVVDEQGNETPVDEDATFTFALYAGEPLDGHFDTIEQLNEALAAHQREDARTITLSVKAGESASDAMSLVLENWTWTAGERYTITEIGDTEGYSFLDFNNGTSDHCTFTYDPTSELTLTCRNVLTRWDVQIVKVDGDTMEQESPTTLSGAVFALYSPDQDDARTVEDIANETNHPEYADMGISEVAFPEDASRAGYLTDIVTLDDSGTHTWENLTRDRYYLLEVKAPDGYDLPDNPGQIVYRSSAVSSVYELVVPNYRGAILPETGGVGTTLPQLLGGMTAACALALLARRLRRRGEGDAT